MIFSTGTTVAALKIRPLRALLLILITGTLATGSALGYLGMVPGLSDLMGTRKPIDLGVRSSAKDVEALRNALRQASIANPTLTQPASDPSLMLESRAKTVPVGVKVSNAQLSALLNGKAQNSLPLREIQARINPGEVEISGRLNTKNLLTLLRGKGIHPDVMTDIEGMLPWLEGAPLFGILTGGVNHGQMALQISDLRLGGVDLPEGLSKFVSSSVIRTSTSGFPGVVIQETEWGSGELTIKGSGLDALLEP